MKRQGCFYGILFLSGWMLVSCTSPSEYEPSNTIRVSSLPSQNLQLAQESDRLLKVYDEAFLRGVIDDGAYLNQKRMIEKMGRDQMDMYEGGMREQILGCHSERGIGASYLFFEEDMGDDIELPYAHVLRDMSAFK
ncbi:MAG: hypothetical protein ACOY3I_01860 [Verrucomicrobiota bacterium]